MKSFVLDTNIILLDPYAMLKFKKAIVYIPMIVLEELDHFKRELNNNGKNARSFFRKLEEMRHKGSLSEGIKLPHGGMLVVDPMLSPLPEVSIMNFNKVDHQLLAYGLYRKNSILITNDINLKIKGDILGIRTESFYEQTESYEQDEYQHEQIQLSDDQAEEFEKNGEIFLEKEFFLQEFVILKYEQKEFLAKYSVKKKKLVKVKEFQEVFGIKAQNREQIFALDALMNPDVLLVTLIGKAGTGKTLLALASGLEQTIEEKRYEKLLVSRSVIPMGRDLGYLPGDLQEKLKPWMQPVMDHLDFLFKDQKRSLDELINQKFLQIEALSYLRGRNLPHQFFIVDEAQNLTPHEIKTIITRVGEGTKIILSGDPDQIDSPYLDSINNGLTYAANKLKNSSLTAHVYLTKGERSQLSEFAGEAL